MQYWFYVRTGGLTSTSEDGRKNTWYLLASVMTPMKPSTQGTLGSRTVEGHEAYGRAFALVAGTQEAGIWWRKRWRRTVGRLVGECLP